MRTLIYTFLALSLFTVTPAFANHEPGHTHAATESTEKTVPGVEQADHTVVVQVNGLVCDFCARALEKVFGAREEVSGIDVNLDTKLVTIGLKKGADIDDATITQLITDAGYNVVAINR